ncbi:hypothetical protein FRB94_011195 [Tulasnella sp. JGI-2019a]|nr:hypothetical protein FRB94_011195 [Tulasnella sp. JGI-2019a]KAG9000363.1 hypothetical protein FRB93_012757 [Tulasnella sp. JGI-2019a]KAG9034510.1 hypothetical protein FRB95_013077 [Tulasnella sp. JGI-2019a]
MSSEARTAQPAAQPAMALTSQPQPLGIELMFQQIMTVVQKSSSEIAELRNDQASLQEANKELQRQLREALIQNANAGMTLQMPSRGKLSPSGPPSPMLVGSKSPFLSPSVTHSFFVPPPVDLRRQVTSRLDIPGFWAVVPAGGAGTRLWPLSRKSYPKFFLDLTLSGRSLIQGTWDRLLPLTTPNRLMVVTGMDHTAGVKDQLPDLLDANLLSEPSPKESAAAIGLAAAVLARRDPNAIIGSFAADHMISGNDAFLSSVREAALTAGEDLLVTIGIAPSHPATGFGYIRLGEKLDIKGAPNACRVSQFKEKPDARTAAAYLSSGNYRWNAGMFVVKATVLMDLLKDNCPELAEGLEKIADVWEDDQERVKVFADVWPLLPKIAIDHAVAEPASQAGRVAVIPATFGWDDVGDFSSLADILPSEIGQARVLGDQALVVTDQVAGGIIVPASGRLVACLGVDDLVIVDTPDALLVTTRARAQEVKKIVAKCKDGGWKQVL